MAACRSSPSPCAPVAAALDDHRRDDPRGDPGLRAREDAERAVRCAGSRGLLPHRQWRRAVRRRAPAPRWPLLWMIIVATIPAVILGFALEKTLKGLFGAPAVAAFFLIVNGGVPFVAEPLRPGGRCSG